MSKYDTQKFDISKNRVAVLGCGGLGSNIIAHLAGAGVGTLVLCDFDTVSESNLNRQFLFKNCEIGKPKCTLAGQWVESYSPATRTLCICSKIENAEDMAMFSDCDIIVLAVDNESVRRIANRFCTENNIPLVCGGINGFYGLAYLYIPGISACLDCAGLTSPAAINSSVSCTAGVIGSLEAELTIQALIGNGDEAAGKLLVYDNFEISKLKISENTQCKFCGDSAHLQYKGEEHE